MKKLSLPVIVFIIMTAMCTVTACANKNITVQINNTAVEFDVVPQIINDRTMVPMRKIFEALGADVTWDEKTKTATGKKDKTTVLISVGSEKIYKNGIPTFVDSPAVLFDNRILVPVRAVAESFGCGVEWDSGTKTVMITALSETEGNEFIELEGEKYYLTFYDDFNGTELDLNKWSLCMEQERQDVGGWWDDSMTSLDGEGNLVITSSIDQSGRPISGAIATKGKFEQVKGYFEIRCKLQNASGFWSAFWMMCEAQELVGNGAADGVEIDIFEAYDVKEKMIHHTFHWDGYGTAHKKAGKPVYVPKCYDGNFHVFSMLWTDNEYIFYVDGKETYRLSEGDPDFPGSCTYPLYLKVSTEFGTWSGDYNESELPDVFVVDYVKAYNTCGVA